MGGAASVIDERSDRERENFLENLMKSGAGVDEAYNTFKTKYERDPKQNRLLANKSNSIAQLSDLTLSSKSLKTNGIREKDKKSVLMLAIRQLSDNLHKYKQKDTGSSKFHRIPSSYHQNRQESHVLSIPTCPDTTLVSNPVGSSDGKKKRPVLFVDVSNSSMDGMLLQNNTPDEDEEISMRRLPSDKMRISPSGTFYIGKWKIREDGLSPVLSSSLKIDVPLSTKSTASSDGLLDSVSSGGSFGLTPKSNRNSIFSPAHKTTHVSDALLGAVNVNQFVEVGPLGSGASGMVVEALHVPSLTIVALKMLPVYNNQKRQHVSRELEILYKNLAELSLVDDSLEMSTFQDEFQILTERIKEDANDNDESKMDRPPRRSILRGGKCKNILSFYNAFVDPNSGMINLVIEYMDGGSLQDLVSRGGCQNEYILQDIARQTLNGLSFLHDNQAVHRDIKPSNILTSTCGLVKIADFGISKALDATCGFANSFVGTMCYMSPERITGGNYSYSSDIWSFGLTMLSVSEGRFPLSGRADIISTIEEDKVNNWIDHSSEDTKDDFPSVASEFARNDSGVEASGAPHRDGSSYWGMISMICDDPPPKPKQGCSHAYRDFIDACLQKVPDDRSTAKELMKMKFLRGGVASMANYSTNQESKSLSMQVTSIQAGKGARDMANGNSNSSFDSLSSRSDVDLEEISDQNVENLFHNSDGDLKNKNNSKTATTTTTPGGPIKGSPKKNNKQITWDDEDVDFMDAKSDGMDLGWETDENGDFLDVEQLIDRIRVDHLERIVDKLAIFQRSRDGFDAMDDDFGGFDDFNDENFSSKKISISNKDHRKTDFVDESSPHYRHTHPIVPSFEGADIYKWENLAAQLLLPLSVVKVAAKAKIT